MAALYKGTTCLLLDWVIPGQQWRSRASEQHFRPGGFNVSENEFEINLDWILEYER